MHGHLMRMCNGAGGRLSPQQGGIHAHPPHWMTNKPRLLQLPSCGAPTEHAPDRWKPRQPASRRGGSCASVGSRRVNEQPCCCLGHYAFAAAAKFPILSPNSPVLRKAGIKKAGKWPIPLSPWTDSFPPAKIICLGPAARLANRI